MKNTYIILRWMILCFIVILFVHTAYFAIADDTPTPTPPNMSDTLNDLNSKISDLEKKISGIKDQEKTLSSTIAVLDNQIKLNQYKMDATEEQITQLSNEIQITENRMSNLDQTLTDVTKVLIKRIRQTYQLGTIEPVQILLTSQSMTNFVSRMNYLQILQAHDRRLIYDTQQAKNDYANQKQIFEGKKQKVESLKQQLQTIADDISQQKKDKQALLEKTKNDDSLYQQQLDAARAEQQAIAQISSGGGDVVSEGDVHQNDTIGHMIVGKSACSSGTHLHYEVHKDGNLQDAAGYLANKSVIFDNSPDGPFSFSGSYDFPLSDPIKIEQGYGMTYWARTGWYGGGPHTGIDMFSDTSTAVHAVKSGKLYRGGIACGGGTLLFARVDQDDGIQSFYLHIVP